MQFQAEKAAFEELEKKLQEEVPLFASDVVHGVQNYLQN